MKRLIFSALLCATTSRVLSQDTLSYEYKALAYFNTHILPKDERLNNVKVKFPKTSTGKPTEIYYLALALGENDFKVSPELDSLSLLAEKDPLNHRLIDLGKMKPVQQSTSNTWYAMSIFNSVIYKKERYVEILLVKRGAEKYIFIKFEGGAPKQYFFQGLTIN